MTKEEIKALLAQQRAEVLEELGKVPDSDNMEKATTYAKQEWINVKKAFNFLEERGLIVEDYLRADYFKELVSEKLGYIEAKQERESKHHVPVALR